MGARRGAGARKEKEKRQKAQESRVEKREPRSENKLNRRAGGHVRSVREEGRDVSGQYGREEGGGAGTRPLRSRRGRR